MGANGKSKGSIITQYTIQVKVLKGKEASFRNEASIQTSVCALRSRVP